jgi:hypothetical protein
MSFDAQSMYELLPAIYRIRDAEQGEPLKALIAVIAREVAVLEEDLAQLYDDQFIETCADWAVPYIGDLIGYRSLSSKVPQILGARAEVANTISYRRRKGTATMLEQLARDVTQWDARVVEFFQRLATTQYMNHLRLQNQTADVHRLRSLERLNTAFDTDNHTLEVRRISQQRGRYNIPNVGIFLWRLRSDFVSGEATAKAPFLTTARKVMAQSSGYTFNPVGLDVPLFNPPIPLPMLKKLPPCKVLQNMSDAEISDYTNSLAQPCNVAEPLPRLELYEELETRRQASVDGQVPSKLYFNESSGYQAFQIWVNDQPISPDEILICDLSNWRRPPTEKHYEPWQRLPTGSKYRPKPLSPILTAETPTRPIKVAVDPVLGRITFPDDPQKVEVSYASGFSMNLGGGFYDRSDSVFGDSTNPVIWQWKVSVTQLQPPDSSSPPRRFNRLSDAITAWNSQPPGTKGIIALSDSRTYAESIPSIQIPAGSQLLIVAANDNLTPAGQIDPTGLRPHLLGDLSVKGTAAATAPAGTFILNGLLLEGKLTVEDGNLGSLQLAHCTLVPSRGGITVAANNERLALQLDYSICGSLSLLSQVPSLQISNSIVDGGSSVAIAAADTDANLEATTVLGSSKFRTLEASNSLFTGQVVAVRRQAGCVRFSYLPQDPTVPSLVARRYRCQPDLALVERAKVLGLRSTDTLPDAEQTAIRLRLIPQFTSIRYGNPGYTQLSQRCAQEIRQGADDEAEMGAFHDLFQPQRITNLNVRLEEYLRFGLEAGVFFVT